MRPLGDFVEPCRGRSAGEFARENPWPVLVHCGGSTALRPADSTRAATVDRLVLEASAATTPRLRDAYQVAILKPRQEREQRVSIGCSHHCDTPINDASVSRLHAWLEGGHGNWRLSNNDATAGTAVNGEPLAPRESRTLQSGDTISLGTVDLVYLEAAALHELVRRLYEL